MPDSVEVIILNWNGSAFLPECLKALSRQTFSGCTVTVVDNGSTDGSPAWVRQYYPAVTIIENGLNLGFAAGNNVALRRSTSDIIILLNPDVIVSMDWVAQLVETMKRQPNVAVAGSKLWYPDGQTIQHGGGFLRPPQAMPGHFAINEADSGQADESRDVDYVIGGAVALRREALQEVGLLDEGYFLYFEDADYCERARRAGWRVVYEPRATAVHVESATAIKGSFAYLQRFHTGRWRYILKHYAESTILDETIAAEQEWLGVVGFDERLAVALAYQTSLAGRHEILEARDREGNGALDEATAVAIRDAIASLRDIATAPPLPPADLRQLLEKAEVTVGEFQSDIPFVAAFRTAWNNIATRWYVRPLALQQNAFNAAAAVALPIRWLALQEQMTRVTELQAIHAGIEEDARALAQLARETQEQLGAVEARLAARGHRVDQGS